MNDTTPQENKERFQSLPEVIRQTISDPATYESIEKIALAHKLTRVEAGLLAQSTSMLMMGFLEPNQYVVEIVNQLSISREDASFIAQEINRDIFNPIKDALKEVHAMDKNSSVRQVTSPTERPLGTAPIVPSAPILPNLSVLPSHAAEASAAQVPLAPQPILAGELQAPRAVPKPLPNFSVAQALGNIPSTGSSQNTAMPSEVPKAQIGTVAAAPLVTQQSGNILEDKLGGAYRMKTETTNSVGVPSLPLSPTQIVPPRPQATKPSETPEKSALAKALDPYREAPL